MNALDASQKINTLCSKLESIGNLFEQFENDDTFASVANYFLEKESTLLKELRVLQDKLDSIIVEN